MRNPFYLDRSSTEPEAKRKLSATFKSPMRAEDRSNTQTRSPSQDSSALQTDNDKLVNHIAQLDQEIQQLVQMGIKEEELIDHIDKLHTYNEMKDIAQMLLGKIAMEEGCTTKDLYGEFGLDLVD